MRPQPQEINVKTYVNEVFPKLRYEGPYKKAVDVAEYYGFRLIAPLKPTKDDRDRVEEISCPVDRATLLRRYLEKGMDGLAQPVQLCHTCKIPYQPTLHFKLETVGTKKCISEALLIHTAYIILQEYEYNNIIVAINSVGGEESLRRYKEELITYYKKHLDNLDEDTRAAFMNGKVFAPLYSNDEASIELRKKAPRPISFLTEQSREHFAEILEYLEMFDIPYYIKNDLFGADKYSSNTIFHVYEQSDDTKEALDKKNPLAFGERYDYFSKHIGLGRKIPAAGITIDLKKKHESETISKYKQKRNFNPLVYVVQVGHDARRGSLDVLERLRQAEIPVAMSFAEERLAHQMKHAESLDIKALIIIGQKEISEGTAIIRNRSTHVQKVVPQNSLPSHIKRLCALY